ncbi:5-formyltetrahydrofolate cyclo-ligase [Halorubrum alkaliphilum]|uniref:5-formyltetrahydrofolate cyclo-ligase n=1 Tax=Halorubrum alkaliphilum TaxID=261290 RepID=A0A8T4GBR4_9EURY|nr:5-formyltetrahydrofolate cyclo-ligase [Halorubrum alkaliphilum]MBP1921546.1 5-formyltetrahydrofolate cyclo-ligase [Halorubrum alkaliphilum]
MDKQTVREAVWDALADRGEARFPFPPHGRIPNFAGASDACTRLTETAAWASATTVKANPDAPQLPVRRAAMRAGKTVYMAQPRLRDPKPFLRLDPDEVTDIDEATTVSGVSKHGVPVAPEAVPRIDLVVSGSVAVRTDGTRIGKGEGYSDLEWAVLRELDAVDDGTTVATTVHECQVVDSPESPIDDVDGLPGPDRHDVPMDLIVTPDRVVRPTGSAERPTGVDWDLLDEETLSEIPVLAERAPDEC